MSISFIGNTEWAKSEPDVWAKDSWGLDTLRVFYRGRVDKQATFRSTFSKWQQHSSYRSMRLASITDVNVSANFPGITLEYTGFADGKIPEPKATAGTSIQSAQASGTSTDGRPISGTFTYQASRTTWTWFEQKKPQAVCPITEMIEKTDPRTRIIHHNIEDEWTGKTRRNVPYSDFVILFNTLVAGVWVTDYNYEMIHPKTLWACTATLDFKIIN